MGTVGTRDLGPSLPVPRIVVPLAIVKALKKAG
jgi:hypothetical protein